jgi:hypothetical protein
MEDFLPTSMMKEIIYYCKNNLLIAAIMLHYFDLQFFETLYEGFFTIGVLSSNYKRE